MIKGMTGFGSAEVRKNATQFTVEIKTVNHRYLDINYYLPMGFTCLEEKIRGILQKELRRGRITLSVRVIHQPKKNIVLDKEAVQTHLKYIHSLCREFRLTNDVTVSGLIHLPGVLSTQDAVVKPKELWPVLEVGIKRALRMVVQVRRREGRSLRMDILEQVRRMDTRARMVEKRLSILKKQKMSILTKDEFGSYQKSVDINEEIARLRHYFREIRKYLGTKEPVGKRIDFIAQEMQREINTIGSKVQDTEISNAVIAVKSKVEKIREQAQNIE